MQKWEYRFIQLIEGAFLKSSNGIWLFEGETSFQLDAKNGISTVLSHLNSMGGDCWEVVGVTHVSHGPGESDVVTWTLKRPLG